MKSSAFSVSSEILLGIKEISELINLLSVPPKSERGIEIVDLSGNLTKNIRLSYFN